MQTKINIFFSHMKEGDSFLFHSGIKFVKINNKEFIGTINNTAIKVVITGIGKKSIAFLKNFTHDESCLIIKAGTCAVIDPDFPLLKAFIPMYISDKDREIKVELDEKFDELLIQKKILTIPEPLFNTKSAITLSENYSFVDMETFYIAEYFNGKNFIPLLVGTDRGTETAKFEFLKNLKEAGIILRDKLLEIFNILL